MVQGTWFRPPALQIGSRPSLCSRPRYCCHPEQRDLESRVENWSRIADDSASTNFLTVLGPQCSTTPRVLAAQVPIPAHVDSTEQTRRTGLKVSTFFN